MKFLFTFFLISIAISTNAQTLSFSESDLILETSTGKISGTLTLPEHFNIGPVTLIIAGSGPTDRNGNNSFMKNNSLQMIAHGLAENNIASVRFDKRGIAASASAMTQEENLRFDTYINDVKEWISLLKKDKRFSSIVVAGHSEGALIGMVAAQKNSDKYISISGAGEPIANTLKRQLSKQPDFIKTRSYTIIDSLQQGLLIDNPPQMLASLFRPSVQPYLISWFKYDPQTEIKKLKIPVLILQGDQDLQVTVDDANHLKEAKEDAKLIIIKGMNHVLKDVTSNSDNQKSYNDAGRPLNKELIQEMVNFILH